MRLPPLSKPFTEHPSPGCGWEPTPLSLPQCRWEVKFLAQHLSQASPGCCQHKPGWLHTPSPACSASNQLLAFFFLISIHYFLNFNSSSSKWRGPTQLITPGHPWGHHSLCHLALCHLQPFCKNHCSCSFYSLCCSFFIKYTSPWKSHLL